MDRLELQKLRDLPIEGVAERLGLRVVRHKCLCPFHDDHHASMSFKVSKNTFRCFACGAGGGVIDLVMRSLRKDFKEACQWLQTLPSAPPCREGNGYSCNGIYSSPYREGSGVGLFDASRYERFFERPWLNEEARRFLFDERRIDARVVRWCRLTSWRDRQGVPWLQIPYFDREGKLIGIQNRHLAYGSGLKVQGSGLNAQHSTLSSQPNSAPHFRFPQGSKCSIYNLPVLKMLKPGEPLYITEGCSDCWAMLSAGHKAIAIPSATLLSKKDVELLNGLNSSPRGEDGRGLCCHMYPDNDVPGERLFLQLKEVLPSLERHQLPVGCKDFSEYYLKLNSG